MLGRVDRVCPLLGLAGDRGVTIDGVDAAHRCYAEDPPSPLDRSMQAAALPDRRLRAMRALPRVRVAHRRRDARTRFRRRRLRHDPPAPRAATGLARHGRARADRAPHAAGSLIARRRASALGLAGAAIAGPLLGDREPRAAVASATPTADPTPTATRHAVARRPSPTPSPTPTQRRRRLPPPTPAPTPAPTPVRDAAADLHRGRGRHARARSPQRFGTTVAALQAANGIDDPDEIVIGQVLVIP